MPNISASACLTGIVSCDGNFSIIATSESKRNPNASAVIVSEKREKPNGTIETKIRLDGDNYQVTVNGKDYVFPASHTGYPMKDPSSVYVSYGVFSGGKIGSLNYGENMLKGEVSFTVSELGYDGEKERTQVPFAWTQALLAVDKNGLLRPDDALTRGEAVIAIAKIYADESDITGTYTCDFTDVKTGSELYTAVSFMQRCGYLPSYGAAFAPEKPVTRSEFAEMLLDENDKSEGISLRDVSADDRLYDRICYAVSSGILKTDENGNFNPNGSITRGEAAQALFTFFGKTDFVGVVSSKISDVGADHPYADAKDAEDLIRNVYRCGAPVYLTIDTGHQFGQQHFLKPDTKTVICAIEEKKHLYVGAEEAHNILLSAQNGNLNSSDAASEIMRLCEENDHLFSEPCDSDTWSWIKNLGKYSPIIHLQQTDNTSSAHRDFSPENKPDIDESADYCHNSHVCCIRNTLCRVFKKR